MNAGKTKEYVAELRFGHALKLYYDCTGQKLPRQLDLIAAWFPGLLIEVKETDGNTKEEPEYSDTERMIRAVRYHGHIYSGAHRRIAHITGRLTGTSSANADKERRTGELIQKHIARRLINDRSALPSLQENAAHLLSALDDPDIFRETLTDYIIACAEARENSDEYTLDSELYPIDDEVFDQILYNALFQLRKDTESGLVNAWLWVLAGSFLRNACGRLTRTYDSSFIPLFRSMSEDGSLTGRLEYLLYPERYTPFYDGDDTESRFPGIEWYCDHCGDHLNEQEGFDDRLPVWQCRKCGYLNPLDESCIYDNEEEWRNDTD